MNNLKCPKCGSKRIVKFGFIPNLKGGRKQRYRCQNCGKTFYPKKKKGGK